MTAMCMNLVAALTGLVVLKPMRVRHFAAGRIKYANEETPAPATPSGGLASRRIA